jgi:DNA-binding LacI/PurR family transcriptional regulator
MKPGATVIRFFLCNSDENPEKEIKYLQLLRRHRIAGLIAATIHERPARTEALTNLAAQRLTRHTRGGTKA